MPTRMEEIAARSAKTPAGYRANKAANDRKVAEWRQEKKNDTGRRKESIRKVTKLPEPYMSGRGFKPEPGRGAPMVLQPVVAPVVATEPPADMVDYSLAPVEATPPWEQMPGGGKLNTIPIVMGTMLVYLGKRLIISMAMTGAAEVGKFAMEGLGTYTKNAKEAKLRFHTGRSGSPSYRTGGAVRIVRDAEGRPKERSSGTGYVSDDPAVAMRQGFERAWEIVKQQWSDPSTWLWWANPR